MDPMEAMVNIEMDTATMAAEEAAVVDEETMVAMVICVQIAVRISKTSQR